MLALTLAGSSAAWGSPSTDPTPSAPFNSSTPGQAAPNTLIDPQQLESVQQSIVGVVTVWTEPADPFAELLGPYTTSPETDATPQVPVMSFCTGWFASPDTIVTAGHCVDPKEGRLALDLSGPLEFDPQTGMPLPPRAGRPDPERAVFVFQPRELPGRIITAPTQVRVHSFRTADDGDTAKLELHGLPPGHPLPIAQVEPRTGEAVTSIGFPGVNIAQTDGVELTALMNGANPAQVLQDSRLQPVSSSGTLTARQYRNGSAVFQTNADLATGTSGGPTINARGEVLGVNSMMNISFTAQNLNVVTDAGMLREFLGRDTDVSTPPSGSSEGASIESPPQVPTVPGRSVPIMTSAADDADDGSLVVLPALGALAGAGIVWVAHRVRARRRPADTGGRHGTPEDAPEQAT